MGVEGQAYKWMDISKQQRDRIYRITAFGKDISIFDWYDIYLR
jgi:hypothetical protein